MTDWRLDYWADIVADSLAEHKVEATPKQIAAIAKDMQGSHENWHMVEPAPSGRAPFEAELEQTKRLLAKEQDKITCRECGGSGTIEESFGPIGRCSVSQCWKCRGEGRHTP